jgi:hypothetical protein
VEDVVDEIPKTKTRRPGGLGILEDADVGMGEVYLSIRRGLGSKDQHLGVKLLQVKRPLVGVGVAERGADEAELPANSCTAQVHSTLRREPLGAAYVMIDNEAVAIQRISVRVGEGRTRAVKVAADVRSAQVDLALRQNGCMPWSGRWVRQNRSCPTVSREATTARPSGLLSLALSK